MLLLVPVKDQTLRQTEHTWDRKKVRDTTSVYNSTVWIETIGKLHEISLFGKYAAPSNVTWRLIPTSKNAENRISSRCHRNLLVFKTWGADLQWFLYYHVDMHDQQHGWKQHKIYRYSMQKWGLLTTVFFSLQMFQKPSIKTLNRRTEPSEDSSNPDAPVTREPVKCSNRVVFFIYLFF